MRLFARGRGRRQSKVAAASDINVLGHDGSETEWISHAKPLLWLLVWAVIGYAAWVNLRAAASLDYAVLGLVLDLAGPIGFAVLTKALRERRLGMACFSALVAGLALSWSLFSALNTGAHGTFGAEMDAKHAASQVAALKADIAKAEEDVRAAGKPRPTVTIEAAISAIVDDPRADGCKEINGKFTKAECPKLGPLRAELGQAKARDAAGAKLAALKARETTTKPVAGEEPYVRFAVRAAAWLGYSIDADGARLSKTVLYVFALEALKMGLPAWVAWLTPRSSPASIAPAPNPEAPSGLAPPARTKRPAPKTAAVDPSEWLLRALASETELPAGIEREAGGLLGSYGAFAAAWGVSPAKAQRMGKAWQESGAFTVQPSRRGTWIGPAERRKLRAV